MNADTIRAQALALGWVDWALLAVLFVSVLVGLVRGFLFELMALIGWVVAYFAARWYSPELAPHLPVGSAGSALNAAVAFGCVFIGSLIVWGLLARLLRMLLRATPLSGVDRLLGAVFGLLRGMIVLCVVATLVMMTPAATSAPWQASHGAQRLTQVMDALRQALPEAWGERLRQRVGM